MGNGADLVSMYEDEEIIMALAKLSHVKPNKLASIKAQLKRQKGFSIREFDRVLKASAQKLQGLEKPPESSETYFVVDGHTARPGEGGRRVRLANFTARITEEIVWDDGLVQTKFFALEGELYDGRKLPRKVVLAKEFPSMNWLYAEWGAGPILEAGYGAKEHMRVAIQQFSESALIRNVYAHTGWRTVGGEWVYLHGGGAIGKDGPVEGIEVELPDPLRNYLLPNPPKGKRLIRAVRASMGLLRIAPEEVSYPLFGAIYRAAVAPCDFSVAIIGATGVGKTELAALAQAHWGKKMDARHLPAGWASTANALEGLASVVKDALLVVDDFCPTGSAAQVYRQHSEADRLLRSQGNRSGRGRLQVNETLRPVREPRGLILITGEDVPRGQSLRARMVILELGRKKGTLRWPRLSKRQADAADGLYAEAMAGFIRWLSGRRNEIDVNKETADMRASVEPSTHRRASTNDASILLGIKYFLEFAQEVQVLDKNEVEEIMNAAREALRRAAKIQTKQMIEAEPAHKFLRLITAALASGHAHVADRDGHAPNAPEIWGWRRGSSPQGACIGWVQGEDLYLEPEAASAVAQRMAHEQGESLGISAQGLGKSLREQGFLKSVERKRKTPFVRKTLQGKERKVLHLHADCLGKKKEYIVLGKGKGD